MKSVRAWFFKQKDAKYISHLDLNRCMLKAVKRAKIPIWYTEGFNPHPFITFSLPLPLGIAGKMECMDFKLTDNIENEKIKSMLNNVLPTDIKIIKVTEPVMKPNQITYALYSINILSDELTTNELYIRLKAFIEQEKIIALKKSKRGVKEINLKEYIKDYSFKENKDHLSLKIILCAGNTTNINPNLILNAFSNSLNHQIYCSITREKLIDENANDFK